jgi:hypothetical protein
MLSDVELATLEWVDWFNTTRLHSADGARRLCSPLPRSGGPDLAQVWKFRIAAVALPPAVYLVVHRDCAELRDAVRSE